MKPLRISAVLVALLAGNIGSIDARIQHSQRATGDVGGDEFRVVAARGAAGRALTAAPV